MKNIEAETAKLAGLQMDLLQKVRSGKITLKQFEEFLNQRPKHTGVFPVFKTIKLGTHKSIDELRQSLKDDGNRIGKWGNDILSRIALAESETELTLHVGQPIAK